MGVDIVLDNNLGGYDGSNRGRYRVNDGHGDSDMVADVSHTNSSVNNVNNVNTVADATNMYSDTDWNIDTDIQTQDIIINNQHYGMLLKHM